MRKFISVLLALMLVFSLTTVVFNAYNVVDDDAITSEEACEDVGTTAKVYFQMPNGENGPVATQDVYVHHPEELDEQGEVVAEAYDELVIGEGDHALSWYNDFNLAADGNHYAGIYWWDAPASPSAWPGYRMSIDDYDNSIFYAIVPGDGDLTSGIFNNGVDGGTDSSLPIYYEAAQTIDNNMEGAYAGDYDTLWEDTYNEFDFDGCIYVIDPDQVSINAFSGKQTCGGNWYFYYGNGCYGNVRTDSDDYVSAEDNCVNPDHHHGEEPTDAPVEPTDAPVEPTDAPAEPTDAPVEPTEAPVEPTDAPVEPTDAPVEDVITVYFTNGQGWSNVNAYFWGTDADPSWPGASIEFDHQNDFGQDVYKAVLPATVQGLIFNNGEGDQTIDITENAGFKLVDGAEFYTTTTEDGKVVVEEVGVDQPTEEPIAWEKGYYLTGTVADWGLKEGMMLTDEGDGLYSYGPIALTANDMIKVIDVNKKGTGIGNWYPDGMDNNRTVPVDAEYMIYFRPAGDGTAEDGWEYIPYEGDDSGEDAHGCKNGGYMFKFVGNYTEPTDAPVEPTDAPVEPTDAPVEPTEAPAPVFEYDTVYAVGNGEGNWLNGITWDPGAAANEMTQTADDVWEIKFEDVPSGYDRQIKFAIDGTWDRNFGGAFEANDTATDAVYNGDNITFDTEKFCNVTAKLDLTGFDPETNTGAVFTITIEEIDTPDQPTDAPAPTWEKGYYLTGTVADWGLKEGMMLTEEGDGLYSFGPIALTADDMIKVIDVNKKGTGIGNWYPDGMDNNQGVDEDGEYTIYFRPAGDGTEEDGYTYIYYVGDGSEDAQNHGCTRGGYMFKFVKADEPVEPTDAPVEPTDAPVEPTDAPVFEYEAVNAVGNGDGAWLNGVTWDPAAEANLMTEIEENVWEITFKGVPADQDCQIKFAIDGNWNHNFGGTFEESGKVTNADYNGANITFSPEKASDITAKLDLTNFDIATQTGATFTITITESEEPVPTDEPAPTWEKGYYLTGTVADWGLKEGMMLTDEGDGLYSFGPIALTTDDMIKVIDVNKKGTGIGNWYPDGMDNNRTVPADGEYMIYFRPAGDGTEEDGWEYIYYIGDGSEDAQNHGCTRGGYMFKFVSEDQPEPAYILGDADGDGEVTAADVTMIQRYDAQMSVGESFNEAAADVDGDGEVTILDATLIQRYLAKIGTKWDKRGINEPVYAEA